MKPVQLCHLYQLVFRGHHLQSEIMQRVAHLVNQCRSKQFCRQRYQYPYNQLPNHLEPSNIPNPQPASYCESLTYQHMPPCGWPHLQRLTPAEFGAHARQKMSPQLSLEFWQSPPSGLDKYLFLPQ